MDGWVNDLFQTGQIAIKQAGAVGVAQAQADGSASQYAASLSNEQNNFAQNLVLKQTTGIGSLSSSNMVLLVMVGVAALFIINQANK